LVSRCFLAGDAGKKPDLMSGFFVSEIW